MSCQMPIIAVRKWAWVCVGACAAMSWAAAWQQPATPNTSERAWGPVVQGYQLSIKTDKQVYNRSDTILLEVVLKNAGKAARVLQRLEPRFFYKFDISFLESVTGQVQPPEAVRLTE